MIKNKFSQTKKFLLIAVTFVIGISIGYAISFASGMTPSPIPIISACIGLLVAFGIPIWQTLFLNASKLSVEISSIKRNVSDLALIVMDDYPELAVLKPTSSVRSHSYFISNDEEFSQSKKENYRGKTIGELEELLLRAKQRLRELPEQVKERKNDYERVCSLKPSEFTKYDCDRLNQPLIPEVEYESENKEKTLESIKKGYQERLESLEKRYADLQANLPLTERKVELLRNELLDYRSFFTISASLVNSGRTNTAIKVPGLLRVLIGEGNYIDLKLTLKDFENKSEISANGTRIVIFESSEITTLPEEDRRLINTYWGQSVSSRLYVEDIHSFIHSSNPIAFAEGLYQKIIYDRLAHSASTHSINRT